MMVREQDDIDRVLLGDVERRAAELGQASVLAWGRECRIGQPSQPTVLEHRGRSSYELHGKLRLNSRGVLVAGAACHREPRCRVESGHQVCSAARIRISLT